ncbi:ABC transporter substrate-binding protein [Catenovulum sp. SM1970]|uniref:ABC transporter substrate-binding protein n=1 Tax=Marinifaba aquimaris TaxID=2741323 RepID=UPI001571C2ED|nr:ABC transporter substrate-binding protein [Marinifaba aquimaris]NTS77115.1 ABC transporter substrate-binding protein [Marinifaba aquimaris]
MKFWFLVVFFSLPVRAFEVTFIASESENNDYWQNVLSIAFAAAEDLNINLNVIEADHKYSQKSVIEQIIKGKSKPDLLVFYPYKQGAKFIFNGLEQAKIPFVTLTRLSELEKSQSELIPKNYNYWLAEHSYDERYGGYLLADELIRQYHQSEQKKTIRFLSISGDRTADSELRLLGIHDRLSKQSDVEFVQNLVVNWSGAEAKEKFIALYNRHDYINLVWASSDTMALGVIEAAKELGLKPNKDIFIGGFDWTKNGLLAIKNGQLAASVGGNYLSMGWMLVRAYDYYQNGNKFAEAAMPFQVINSHNLDMLEPIIFNSSWENINFKQFSLTHLKQTKYDFTIRRIIKHLSLQNQLTQDANLQATKIEQ